MYCLRCGREIPDGELFCADCAKAPLEPKQPQEEVPVRVQEHRSERPAEPKPEPQKPPRRRSRLVLPFVLVCLLLVLSCAFTVYSYHTLNLQKASYRVKEANLTLRESELSDLQSNYDTALAELETAKAAMQEKDETIQDLRKEIVDWESAASQREYDAAAAQKRIDELEEENTTLATDNETLAGEKDTLAAEKQTLEVSLQEKTEAAAALQAELESVQGKYTSAKAKADFMDSYVVFVNNDGTGLYHRYDCGTFLKSNFWAYSRKLAQNNGYTACPVCGG